MVVPEPGSPHANAKLKSPIDREGFPVAPCKSFVMTRTDPWPPVSWFAQRRELINPTIIELLRICRFKFFIRILHHFKGFWMRGVDLQRFVEVHQSIRIMRASFRRRP